ncbi:hypothetical protein G7062_08100 [Erysipelothrix sp. HDW6C]|uniref:hypothetical protein n=1 Tax=Erysipelothrix sp. HDW6C TaxID=2714930 RepID=UPI00140A6D6E|nr:hypothetical protein [Erysipelothrix sp. HDW6C]QIK70252.1 hypothetical protein G7062_08100 [Erysipelothrix sp. HDW6C]
MKSYSSLTTDEKRIVDKLLSEGKNGQLISETQNVGKSFDLKVDGIPTEIKTLNRNNINTLVTKVGRALEQLKGENGKIIYDISRANFSSDEINQIWSRLVGKFGPEIKNIVELIP